jgi:hypothetical protein
MLLSELVEVILCESGQFIAGDLECIGINLKQLYKGIVIRELSTYERYRPDVYQFNRLAQPTGNAEATVDFFDTSDSTGTPEPRKDGGIFDANHSGHNVDPGRVPLWISQVVPVNVLTTAGILYLIQETRFTNVGEQSILHEPRTFLWHYERAKDKTSGILYTTETGRLDITAAYEYHRIEMYDVEGNLVDVEFENMEEGKDEIFIDMVLGKFMMKIGRARRAFTLNNSPVQFDSEQLVQEGNTIYDQAKERLYEQSEWWTAIGT